MKHLAKALLQKSYTLWERSGNCKREERLIWPPLIKKRYLLYLGFQGSAI